MAAICISEVTPYKGCVYRPQRVNSITIVVDKWGLRGHEVEHVYNKFDSNWEIGKDTSEITSLPIIYHQKSD